MTAILRLQLDDKDPVRVNSAINQLAEYSDRNQRSKLTANTTFYVSTSGSDSNSGSQAAPFLTIQHAYDVIVSTIDTAGFTITIQLADGTYTSGLAIDTAWSGGGQIILQGNAVTPANVVISTSGNCIAVNSPIPAALIIKNLKVTSSTNSGISLVGAGRLIVANIDFGACLGYQLAVGAPGAFIGAGAYTISGSAGAHWLANSGGNITTSGVTITLNATPAFSLGFAYSTRLSSIVCDTMTFVGSATGTRYFIDSNSVIYTGGGGANYLPGNVAGSVSTGGQYI